MLSLEGRQLGNYDVIRRIRSGGMGAVYEGRQRTAFGRRVAIKVILGSYATDPDMRRRFAREARTVARLHHPHILPLIEFGDEQGVLYLVMPFIDGGTLTSYLRRNLPDTNEVSTIFLQMLDAVEYAHEEGLIHRDIKSSNVLLETRRSGPPYAYLADFGLVRTIQQAELESSYAGTPIPLDQVPGTPHYMAPEQTRGIVTTSTDIYALGTLLYQMLIGDLPYNDPDDIEVIKMHLHAPVPDPRNVDVSIPVELGAVVARAMAKRPEQRFSNVTEFREAFLAALDGPVERVDERTFTPGPENDFEIHELPPRLSRPPQPLKRQITQQLRMGSPEPIEFRKPAAPQPIIKPVAPQPIARQPRITTENPEKAPAIPDGVATVRRVAQTGQIAPVVPYVHAIPRSKPRKRFSTAFVAGIGVPIILILLLLLPRLLGVGLFPSGFPLFGSSPVATIALTVKTQQVQDAFLLTASPNIERADVNKYVMPDHNALGRASDSRTVATSDLQNTPGANAGGMLLFTNMALMSVAISSGFTFTASNGVQVQLTENVLVPSRASDNSGSVTAFARAVSAGQKGNIPAHAISTICCNSHVTVSNPAPFDGGTDTQVNHLVAQSDLDSVKNELLPGLQQKVSQQMNTLLQSDEAQAGKPVYKTTVTSNYPVGEQAAQVTVTVVVTTVALVYNVKTARDLAQQLLNNKAVQSLGKSYQLRGAMTIDAPLVEQQSSNGFLYLKVSASGLWSYVISQQIQDQWRQAIKGASPTLAQSYLTTRSGITSAQIQLPFGSNILPSDPTQIRFVVQE